MMKNKFFYCSAALFIATELVFYYFILFVGGEIGRIVSFVSVVTAFLFSLLFLKLKENTALLNLGLFFTACADFFLVLLQPINQIAGMIFFSFTQLCYCTFLFLSTKNGKMKASNLIVRFALIALIEIIAILVLKDKTDFLSLISVFYFVNLLVNIVFAFLQKHLFLAIALTLFALCDICVGLSVANGIYFTIPETSIFYWIIEPPFNLIWFFYLPSQTLLALCVARSNR